MTHKKRDVVHFRNEDEYLLNIISDIVLRVGRICLASGTGSYRVKQSMAKTAHLLGAENQAHVTLTEINSTCRLNGQFKTEVCNLHTAGVNTDRIGLIERLIRELDGIHRKISRTELIHRLDTGLGQIENKPALYPPTASSLFSATACSSFAFLVGGGITEIAGVFFAAGVGQYARRRLLDKSLNYFFVTMLAAAVAALGYFFALYAIKSIADTGSQHGAGYIAALLFLIPGFPLITGVLDLAKMDFSSGIQRISYAVVVIFCATFSAWLVAAGFHMEPQTLLPLPLPTVLLFALRLVAGFFGVLGFSLLFNSDMKTALFAALIGMTANTFRLSITDWLGVQPQAAALAAACLVGLIAFYLSNSRHCPRIALSVPAVCIMVPGVFMFRAVYYLEQNNITDALNWSVQALLIVAALPMGLALARIITDKDWAFNNSRNPN